MIHIDQSSVHIYSWYHYIFGAGPGPLKAGLGPVLTPTLIQLNRAPNKDYVEAYKT